MITKALPPRRPQLSRVFQLVVVIVVVITSGGLFESDGPGEMRTGALAAPMTTSSFRSMNVTWPLKRVSEVEGNIILGGLMMVHEREDNITCGPIMPQGGIQVGSSFDAHIMKCFGFSTFYIIWSKNAPSFIKL